MDVPGNFAPQGALFVIEKERQQMTESDGAERTAPRVLTPDGTRAAHEVRRFSRLGCVRTTQKDAARPIDSASWHGAVQGDIRG